MTTLQEEWNAFSRWEKTAFVLTCLAALTSILLSLANYPVIGHDSDVHPNWLDQFIHIRESGVHRLRHTFCSHLAMQVAPVTAIQALRIQLLNGRGNSVATAPTGTANA